MGKSGSIFAYILTGNAKWFLSLPESVHACFYHAAVADPTTLAAFANCQRTDGGEKCIRNIPAGSHCLNNVLREIQIQPKYLG